VIGTGHVGLPTCIAVATLGHHVTGVDADEEKIALLRAQTSPFYEPGMADELAAQMDTGRLSFTEDVAAAVAGAEVVFICVGTPPRATGEANLIAVERAARQVAEHVDGECLVVEKSTVPAGTAQRIKKTLARERGGGHRIEVASNPEFLREGRALADWLNPDRILVGADSEWAFAQMRALYAPLVERGVPLIETDIGTAELAKHACNAFLALKVSFANALARMCERAGADVVAIADVMGADRRIGREFLNASLGYGGYCFPKDLQAFSQLAHKLGYDFPLLDEIARINEEALEATEAKVRDALWNLEDKRVALLGLAFKPDTDDVRLSPALALARRLLDEGAHVVAYDPQAMSNAKAELDDLEVAPDPYSAARDAHCVVLCTEWEEFRRLDLAKLKESMSYPVVVDGRNVFEPKEMAAAGFTYYPTGRPRIEHHG
jgi:UDPglucose 6-dehydrogenase